MRITKTHGALRWALTRIHDAAHDAIHWLDGRAIRKDLMTERISELSQEVHDLRERLLPIEELVRLRGLAAKCGMRNYPTGNPGIPWTEATYQHAAAYADLLERLAAELSARAQGGDL